jgi:hypothetical protein
VKREKICATPFDQDVWSKRVLTKSFLVTTRSDKTSLFVNNTYTFCNANQQDSRNLEPMWTNWFLSKQIKSLLKMQVSLSDKNQFKEGPMTKNGLTNFPQSWAIHMKKSN